mgnify:CR=1 FL=1
MVEHTKQDVVCRQAQVGLAGQLQAGVAAHIGAGRAGQAGGDIDWSLTKRILQQASIDPNEWDKLA